ncbi:MAG: ATP-binding cassette domain-containing protein [Lachnospiraceae bacterium]
MALQVEIKKRYPGFVLDVAFSCKNVCTGILGASGCGKSMTLRCIAGVEKPDEGRIVLDGRVLFDSKNKINLSPKERNIGYLFQNYALFPTMTVAKNIACGVKGKKWKRTVEIQELVQRQMDTFHLQGLESRLPGQLSGGQQQRVALARMLIGNPSMIMLDEPFAAMDTYLKDILQHELSSILSEFKGEVLLVSHSRDEIYKLCTQVVVMDKGKTMLEGDTKGIFVQPKLKEVARLTGCKNISTIERINDHELFAKDWNCRLHTMDNIGDEIQYVAIRGHEVRKAKKEDHVNVVEVIIADCVEAPFEYQYLIQSKLGGTQFWWMESKKNNQSCAIPELQNRVVLPPEDLMLLK